MLKLFLSSSFKDVAPSLATFAAEPLQGKKITFIPTASIPEKVKFYVKSAKKALENMGLIVDELELSTATQEEMEYKIRENDYIYISGGNTFYLLQELKRSGADVIIREEVQAGKMFIGESAGSMILAPSIEYAQLMDNVQEGPALDTFAALGVIDFYPVPHHTNIPFIRAVENIIEEYGSRLNLYLISNAEVILVQEDNIRIEKV
ncbi:Type 1 glutamine amidotransferase-like domain-containing protein [Paenibacillus massiliensis]|uniref:Type 1 glutamine amidotransferase-like domain-containing protein n=1 Tax=Paenibacillus massiliensis TaxID=225917 RepID=UPI0003617CA5|nr:Type 1 glutamine amidotransferase-like domain-containing protein [Paenibacillus massiliensis]